ncbi:MAG: radical SAM family heme chaperone HemW [Pseudomonadota bacterium]
MYLHWPFCQAKCPYCDFNSHVAKFVDQAAWAAAFCQQIEYFGELTRERLLTSIFFGGGTPSLMDASVVETILNKARATWRWVNDIEITLEANPTSVEADRFRDYRLAGVNRISMGLQALRDQDLKALGRLHTVAEAKSAFKTAQSIFDRVSFDLIYARQDQSLSDWRSELAEALSFSADHLSLYQLTIEDGTAFADRFRAGGLKGLPDQDVAAEMYEVTQEMCDAAGLPAYEISNHAKPGAESRHNLTYWKGGNWIGIGPGAHGRLSLNTTVYGIEATSNPNMWLSQATRNPEEPTVWHNIPEAEQATERLLMGMRLTEGISLENWLLPYLNHQKVETFQEMRLIEVEHGSIKTTARGRLLLDSILKDIIAD